MTKSIAHKPQPEPADITYEWVRDALRGASHNRHQWYAVHEIIDLLNGWDGHSCWPHESLQKARQKLQSAPGHSTHQHPTSAQSGAVRRHLVRLADEKLVEKQRGGARSNNGFSYRWITPAILHQKMHQQDLVQQARALAQRITLALGGANTQPLLVRTGSRHSVEIQVTLSEQVAEKLLAVLDDTGFSGDYFKEN